MHGWGFVYQYGIGGAFFLVCIVLLVRARAIDLSRPSGRRNLAIMLAGLALYAAFHALSIFVLPRS